MGLEACVGKSGMALQVELSEIILFRVEEEEKIENKRIGQPANK